MASLSLKHIFKVYDGGVKAVNDFCMEIEDKEFIVFVGPSGCGKSTTLRMIAGLEEITAGELRIDNEVVNDFEPKDRNIAMVFQNYALYPHMTVYENMAFSLRTAHVPSSEVHKKVMEAAEILGITEYLKRKPKALSGGQRQRVALGRAIVRKPKVFLLDEPLSNLDAKLRAAMRTEISLLHERLGTTFIYVTHDQVEAMTMGTRIVVMRSGCIQQIDTPVNLYKYPDNIFVAGFIGTPQMNFFDATISRDGDTVAFNLSCGVSVSMPYVKADKIPLKYMDGKTLVVFGIRPDDVKIDTQGSHSDDNSQAKARAVVSVVEVLGGETLVYANLNIERPTDPAGAITLKADPDVMLHRGDVIDILISLRKFHVFDKATERSIRRRVPRENIIVCDVANGNISFENQSFPLPPAILRDHVGTEELTMPIDALVLGTGTGKASIQWLERIEGKTLYFVRVGSLTLFSIEDGEPKYAVGDKVSFDVDMRLISIEGCAIYPVNLENTLSGRFTKEKGEKHGTFNFRITVDGQHISPTLKLSEKLFSCKGTGIFSTPLEFIFNAHSATVVENGHPNSIVGTITRVLDYGDCVYSKVSLGENELTVLYNGTVGDRVSVVINGDEIAVKDKSLDIIIA